MFDNQRVEHDGEIIRFTNVLFPATSDNTSTCLGLSFIGIVLPKECQTYFYLCSQSELILRNQCLVNGEYIACI